MKLGNYRNNKTGNVYTAIGFTTNATNAQDGQEMVMYISEEFNPDFRGTYVRSIEEFLTKFTRI